MDCAGLSCSCISPVGLARTSVMMLPRSVAHGCFTIFLAERLRSAALFSESRDGCRAVPRRDPFSLRFIQFKLDSVLQTFSTRMTLQRMMMLVNPPASRPLPCFSRPSWRLLTRSHPCGTAATKMTAVGYWTVLSWVTNRIIIGVHPPVSRRWEDVY